MERYGVMLAGNPNVGKSSVFNRLTGLKQHTGNWCGKTVSSAEGTFTLSCGEVALTDLPGIYSLDANSAEEEAAREYITAHSDNVLVYVCDATSLERGMLLFCAIRRLCGRVLLCVNLIDEAEKKGIRIDLRRLGEMTGCPVAAVCARSGRGFCELSEKLDEMLTGSGAPCVTENDKIGDDAIENDAIGDNGAAEFSSAVGRECVTVSGDTRRLERRIDAVLCGKYTALPSLLALCGLILWLTLSVSSALSAVLESGLESLYSLLLSLAAPLPPTLVSFLLGGVVRTVFKVVSVMLPPMAVFFPLFTVLEDSGFLPRIAFDVDVLFEKCGVNGKQSLTMLMGLGCNAVGVTGCRIIESPRERRIAVLTNSIVPCNGRFPIILAAVSCLPLPSYLTAAVFVGVILFSFVLSLLVSLVLSRLRPLGGKAERRTPFVMELPPYRFPNVGEVIVRSLLDRILYVLLRAIKAAAPAGALIWLMNRSLSGGESLFSRLSSFLEPLGRMLGMCGEVLLSFILAFPAAELMLPVALSSGDLFSGSAMGTAEYFASRGMGTASLLCVLVFTLLHAPCATTLATVRRESGLSSCVLAALIPTALGVLLCSVIALFIR